MVYVRNYNNYMWEIRDRATYLKRVSCTASDALALASQPLSRLLGYPPAVFLVPPPSFLLLPCFQRRYAVQRFAVLLGLVATKRSGGPGHEAGQPDY